MRVRASAIVAASLYGIFLGGCVSSGTYQAKEMERQRISKTLDETKSSYIELKDKFSKLEDDYTEQTARLQKITAETEDVRRENIRLATEYREQSENLKLLSAEFVDLKIENARLVEATKPENILKTLAEAFSAQKQKIKMLTDENRKLRIKFIVLPTTEPVEVPGNELDSPDPANSGPDLTSDSIGNRSVEEKSAAPVTR